MKKFWTMFLTAVVVAAGVVPAMAADYTLSGELRVRYQYMDDYDFNSNVDDSMSAISQRTRINAKVDVDDRTTAFISLQDTRNWGQENSTASTGSEGQSVDLSQGWLKIDNTFGPVALKMGRQPLAYGNQRLVGGFEWSNNARRFDAFKFIYGSETFDLDFWISKVVETGNQNSDGHFNGIWSTLKTIPNNKLHIYLLQKQDISRKGEDILNLGVLLQGKNSGFDYTAEYNLQSGDYSDNVDQDATAWALTGGYTFADMMNLRIGGEYVMGEGNEANSSDNEAFDNLFPTNHPHYGLNDCCGEGQKWSNLEALALKVSLKPTESLKLLFQYWTMENEEPGTDIGDEISLAFYYPLTEKVKLHGYYVQFDPDANAADEAEKLVLQAHAKF